MIFFNDKVDIASKTLHQFNKVLQRKHYFLIILFYVIVWLLKGVLDKAVMIANTTLHCENKEAFTVI